MKYLSPVSVGEEIEIVSRLEDDAGRVAYSTGEIFREGKVCVRARGKFLPMSEEATRQVIPYLKFDRCRKYRTLFGRSNRITSYNVCYTKLLRQKKLVFHGFPMIVMPVRVL